MNAPYYANTNPENSTSRAATEIRKAEYQFWEKLHPGSDDDIEIISQSLSDLTGARQSRIRNIIFAFERLKELPRLRARQEQHFHLDLDRLITIDQTLAKLGAIDAEKKFTIDDALTNYLTPTRPNQKLPSHRNLRRKLRELIVRLDPSIAARDPRRKQAYSVEPTGGEWAAVCLDVGLETAEIIDRNIRDIATDKDLTMAEAAVELLTGKAQAKAKVVLNMYRCDLPDAPAFVQNLGWVSPETADDLQARATATRDMEKAGQAESPNYVTPPDIRAFVEGLDGTCRWPGCTRPAVASQMDHRHDFADGGPTSAANLTCLCQHHHNIKTDGRAFYIKDPISGDIVWLFDDSTWVYDSASGPLAPKNRRWAQTVAQATQKRRENAHADAQQLKEELREESTHEKGDSDDTVPEE